MQGLNREIRRFIVVGSTTVAIDFFTYGAMLLLGMAIASAKAIGFATGMLFAWVANRIWTFSAGGGWARFAGFTALYMVTLAINVSANQIGVSLLGTEKFDIVMAFLFATGLSATANFLGMKFVVFRT